MNEDTPAKRLFQATWIAVNREITPEDSSSPWTLGETERKLLTERADFLRKTLPWALPFDEENQHEPIKNTGGIALFAKTFPACGVRSAVIDSTALGIYDLYINGRRVGGKENERTVYDEFKPGWTDYSKRVLYYTYDVTDYLCDGENTVLAAVASGWWNGHISLGTYGDNQVAFLASLTFTDQTGAHTVTTDESWLSAWGSSIRAADIWDGELYDARFPAPSEISADLSLCRFAPVVTEEHNIEITPHFGPTVRIREQFSLSVKSVVIFDGADDNGTDFGKIHKVREYTDGAFVLHKGERAVVDFEQNMTGYPRITLHGARGTTVQLRTGEMLNDDGSFAHGNDAPAGTVYSSNLRAAKSKAYYILAGGASETYHPTFAFFGYRYLEIAATDDIEVTSLVSLCVGSDIRETGNIETSSADVNRLISNIKWGQRSNYLSVPTDCPQRDERLGWTGDTQAFSATAAYNGDVLDFLRKWLGDARDSQSDEGPYPDCIPRTKIFGEGAAGWGDAGIIVPHVLWQMYGDTGVIKEHFASMEKYMDWLETRGLDGPKAVYCDWLSVEDTDGEYISVCYYALDAGYMADMARAIGEDEKADHYADLKDKIAPHFREKYCDASGNLKPEHHSQTAYLLALGYDLLLPKNRADTIKKLRESIISRGYHLSTGFLGTGIINKVLAEIGENGLAYSLLMQTEMPSWLYCVKMGATTVWERWDSFTNEHGFTVYGVDSSFNHYSYGALLEWIYRYVAGIDTDTPGFEHPVLHPMPDTRTPDEIPSGEERLEWVRAEFDSPVGMIKSAWDTRGGFTYKFTLPVPATVILPRLTNSDTFTLNGEKKRFDEFDRADKNETKIELKPGEYEIKMNNE